MPDKDQQFIFSRDELFLIKNTFADNDTLLYTIRKVFLQFPLTEPEKNLLKLAVTPKVLHILKKRMLPELSPEYPLGQLPSILTTLTQDLKSKSLEDISLQFEAKDIEIAYLAQQFEILETLDFTREFIKLSIIGNFRKTQEITEMTPANEVNRDKSQYIFMTAYLFLLGYIDPSLLMIKILAGAKEETPEQQVERLSKDSNK